MTDNNEFRLFAMMMMWIAIIVVAVMHYTCSTPERTCITTQARDHVVPCLEALREVTPQ
jgi:hypothetical protein